VNGSFNPASCITGADGTCSTKYTVTNPTDVVGSGDDSPDWVEVYDYVQTVVSKPSARPAAAEPTFVEGDYAASYDAGANPDGYAFVEWHNPYPDEARNVTVTPVSAGQPSGGAQDLVATVTDRFGDPVAGACVGWATTGPGEITSPPNLTGASYCVPEPDGAYAELDNGGASTFYDYECATNASGQCGVQVGSGPAEAGAETVTADIANYTNENNWINTSVGGQGGPDLGPRIAENAAEEAAQECSLPANATYGDGYDAGDGFDNGDGNNEGEFASLADLQDTSALAGHTPYYLDGGAENHFAETDGAFAIPHVTAGNCHASSTVVWQLPGTTNADHITISPTATTIGTNGDRMFTATVRDSSSSPVSGATVTFIQSGPGSFAGSSSITAITDASGHASAVLSTSSAVVSGTVTASISSATTGCSGTGCFATSHYGVKQVITASLLCTSPRPHVVKCVAKVRPHIAGLTVVFRHKVRGHYKRWGTATTNARGRAKLVKDNLTTGKTERVKAHVRSSDATLGATAGPASVTVT
ncbi:MAG: hypothetical protein ACTHK4_06930, partial [Mycobacteriales bacterium]